MQSKATTGLLAAGVVLLGLSLIVETRPAIAANGFTRCCFPDGTCANIPDLLCLKLGGIPGGAGDSISFG